MNNNNKKLKTHHLVINSLDNNEYNIKLYNSVFNNIYLRGIIFNHLSIYNILHAIEFTSHEQLEQFKYKEYLDNIILSYQHNGIIQLPKHIKHIQIRMEKDAVINILKIIPNHIESIKLFNLFFGTEIKSVFSTIDSSVFSKINSFSMVLNSSDDQIELDKLLPSLTELKIYGQNTKLKKEMLPNSLKRIWLSKVVSIENGFSLESLLYTRLLDCSTSIINQISSNNLIKLDFMCDLFNSYNKIDNSIIFPESLQELTIYCYSLSSKLPNNLKTLKLTLNNYEDTIIFPPSLEHITILVNKDVFKNKESVPCNLKSLEISCSSIVDNNGQSILPDKLEKLSFIDYSNIYFNQVLQVNHLPSSLTSLDLGNSYNQVINVNVLPSSLKTLMLGGYEYTQSINPLAIPQQLELLIILNPYYNHPINLPVSTHPNILIRSENLKLCYNPSNTSIRKLRLPNEFNSPLSTLQLQDKSSLEYLHLGFLFDQPIQISDLPIDNNIRTLELSYNFNQTINLEYFQNLETIIINEFSKASITTTQTTNQQQIVYKNYNLKNIIISPFNRQFLINLEKNFYQFIKLKLLKEYE